MKRMSIVIIILIFLGIWWFFIVKEGFEAADFALDLQNTMKSKMAAAGFDLSGASMDDLTKMVTELTNVVTKENELTQAMHDQADASLNLTSPGNTTAPIYPGESFFEGSFFADSFCGVNAGADLDGKCSALTADNCNATSCCIFINGTKCVAGNANGPTTKVLNGKDIDYTYYSWKNKCYGSCGGASQTAANPCATFADDDTHLSSACLNRYWSATGCPNTNFITPTTVNDLANYTKSGVQTLFNSATAESNYANCYGADSTKWPAACMDASGNMLPDTTFGLSQRCLTKLFKDASCSYLPTINAAFVNDNQITPMSVIKQKFALWFRTNNDETNTQCYGPDQTKWPIDACKGMVDTDILGKNLTKRCVEQMWTNMTKTTTTPDGCVYPYSDELDQIIARTKSEPNATDILYSKANLTRILSQQVPTYTSTGGKLMCYGYNVNKWPGATQISPDPCAGVNENTSANMMTLTCRQRLAKQLTSTNTTGCNTLRNQLNMANLTDTTPIGQLITSSKCMIPYTTDINNS